MRFLLAALLALAAAAPAIAQNSAIPNVPRGAEVDGLRIVLVHTADRDAFIQAWFAARWELPLTDRAVRGQPLNAVVIFQGCRAGADGKCDLTGHFTYLRPDGSVAGEIRGALWSEAPPPGGAALPAPSGPALEVEPSDPMGTWTLRVRVTDNVRGVSVETEAEIVVETPPATPASR